ncbi:MAG TPA: FAD-linked oxidase C-terminal domain-containing protein [bacterium]|nr:FAD-linked oxidase C-terminal domain-containing protein [bacterium]
MGKGSHKRKSLARELRSCLGAAAVLDGVEDRYAHGFDATATVALPDFVVIPETRSDLAWACGRLWDAGVATVPRGAGTGYAGGAVPVTGAAVVVCDRLKGIDGPRGGVVEVEPGVVGDDLNRYLKPFGLFYPVDPASAEASTVGGQAATNAGGPRALKYGVTRDFVEALQAISPARGEAVYRGAAGDVDVLGVIVGSEGTLAVIERVWLKVMPVPEAAAAAVASFAGAEAAAEAANDVLRGGVLPAKLEFLDHRCIECVNAREPGTFDEGAAAVLMLEFDGSAGAVAAELEEAAARVAAAGAREVKVAGSKAEAERLWRARRGVSPALGMLAPHKTNEDVCVPRSKVPTLLNFIAALEREYGVAVPTFGHIGDGNLHVNFMYDRRVPQERASVAAAVGRVMEKVVALGGTITGEHGVGAAKAPFLPLEQNAAEFAYARRVKSYFDPAGLLNPGKIFPDN